MPGYVRAAVRREQLLAAARAVLVRDGLDNLTLRSVAAEADVHLSTLQYIFHSRAELVHALAERVLADARYGQFEPGDGGLRSELGRQVEWFVTQFLEDPAMLELVRHEYVTRVSQREPEPAVDLSSEGPLFPGGYEGRIDDIARRAGESYDRSAEELGRLWGVSLTGLFYEYLIHRDRDRFRREAELVVDAVASIARPHRPTA
jgi:AcrR family transcriptional regulator